MENNVNCHVQEETIKKALFKIETEKEATELIQNYEQILEKLCVENGISPGRMLIESSKNKLPFISKIYRNIDGETKPLVSKTFYDVVTDSYTFTEEFFLPVTIEINLEDWSDISVISMNEKVIKLLTKRRETLNYYVITFEIENEQQAKELSKNFDNYMIYEIKYNPHHTGYENKDNNGNIIKPIMNNVILYRKIWPGD